MFRLYSLPRNCQKVAWPIVESPRKDQPTGCLFVGSNKRLAFLANLVEAVWTELHFQSRRGRQVGAFAAKPVSLRRLGRFFVRFVLFRLVFAGEFEDFGVGHGVGWRGVEFETRLLELDSR